VRYTSNADIATNAAEIIERARQGQWEAAVCLLVTSGTAFECSSGVLAFADAPHGSVIRSRRPGLTSVACSEPSMLVGVPHQHVADCPPQATTEPGVAALGATLGACASGSAAALACELLLNDAPRLAVKPNEVAYNATVHACARVGFWEGAAQILHEMRKVGVPPTTVSFTAALSSCKRGGQWRRALQFFEEMARTVNTQPDIVAFCAAISACDRGRRWAWSLLLLDRMSSAALVGNAMVFNAVMSACARPGRWSHALGLMESMRGATLEPCVISFNTVLGACEAAMAWSQALCVLGQMLTVCLKPGIAALRFVIRAGEFAGEPHRVAVLLLKLRKCVVVQSAFLPSVGVTPLRGEYVTAVSMLNGYGILGGALDKLLWWCGHGLVVQKLRLALSGSGANNLTGGCGLPLTLALSARALAMHDSLLEGLFDIGGSCTWAALQDLTSMGGAFTDGVDEIWGSCARAELHDRLSVPDLVLHCVATEAHLATWVSYELVLRNITVCA